MLKLPPHSLISIHTQTNQSQSLPDKHDWSHKTWIRGHSVLSAMPEYFQPPSWIVQHKFRILPEPTPRPVHSISNNVRLSLCVSAPRPPPQLCYCVDWRFWVKETSPKIAKLFFFFEKWENVFVLDFGCFFISWDSCITWVLLVWKRWWSLVFQPMHN